MEKVKEENELQDVENLITNLEKKSHNADDADADEATADSKLLTNGHDNSPVYNEDDWEDYIPEPPDGGWGWVIIIASFFNNFILDGIAYCFGVFLIEYSEYFQASVSITSLSNALLCGVYLTIDEWEDYTPVPPDGGWGWVICMASFFNAFLLDGIANCFGVFLPKLVAHFQSPVGLTSLSSSLLCGFYLLMGPIVGALVNKYGCRPVGFAGSLIGAFAFIVSTFSPNIMVFHLTYGIIGGFGFGMMYLPAVVGVGFYFEKKRAMATGIAVCGTGIGTFAIAPLAKLLLQHMDWKNAHYIFAGLLLQGCIFSALMRPLTGRRRKLPRLSKDKEAEKDRNGFMSVEDFMEIRNQNFTQSSHMLRPPAAKHTPRLHSSVLIKTPQRNAADVVEDLKRPMYRKDIFFSGSLYDVNVKKTKSKSSIKNTDGYAASIVSIPPTEDEDSTRLACLNKLPKSMADILAEMLDLQILRSKGMLILLLANLFGMMGFYAPIVFAADRAVGFGVSETDAALLLSIMGICNTVGRVLSGSISILPNVSPLLVNNISVTLAGIAVALTPFCTTFGTMAVSIAIYGMFASTFISLAPVIIVRLVGLEKLTNGFGLICLMRGLTAIVGPPLEGLLYDITGNYDATFYMGGAAIVMSGFLSCLLHFKYFDPPQKPVNTEE